MWTQLAQIGAALGSSLLGSKLSKPKPNPLESQVLSNTADAQKLGMDTARQTLPQAGNLLNMGVDSLRPTANYWSSILSGNRATATSAMAPEISRINQGYQAASQSSAALNPRGGPTADYLSQLPFQQQRDVSTAMQNARPNAAQQLGQVGSNMLAGGNSLFSNAISSIYGSTSAGRDILNQQNTMRDREAQSGRDTGKGIFDLFSQYGMPALEKQWPNIFGSGTK